VDSEELAEAEFSFSDKATASTALSSLSTTTPEPAQIGLTKLPAPFMPPRAEDLWTLALVSHVSWPSTTVVAFVSSSSTAKIADTAKGENASEKTVSDSYHDYERRNSSVSLGTDMDTVFFEWPELGEEYCAFHKHDWMDMVCHRKAARLDVKNQVMRYG
jgi:hypothetical protein